MSNGIAVAMRMKMMKKMQEQTQAISKLKFQMSKIKTNAAFPPQPLLKHHQSPTFWEYCETFLLFLFLPGIFAGLCGFIAVLISACRDQPCPLSGHIITAFPGVILAHGWTSRLSGVLEHFSLSLTTGASLSLIW